MKNKNSWKYVIKDMKKRNKWGMKQYGVPLTTATNKNFLQETYEELLDAVVYLRSELQLRKNKFINNLTCPGCGGIPDNGFDRCVPPSPYYCTKCSAQQEQINPIMDESQQQYKIPYKILANNILDDYSIFHPYPFKENN